MSYNNASARPYRTHSVHEVETRGGGIESRRLKIQSQFTFICILTGFCEHFCGKSIVKLLRMETTGISIPNSYHVIGFLSQLRVTYSSQLVNDFINK